MKKRCTNNLLLFSALTVILCTMVKAPENSKNTELAGALWDIRLNHTLGHQGLRDQTPRQNPTSAKSSEKSVTKFRRRYTETCQQKAQKETGDQPFLINRYRRNFVGQDNPARGISFLKQFLSYLPSQDDFGIEDFDD